MNKVCLVRIMFGRLLLFASPECRRMAQEAFAEEERRKRKRRNERRSRKMEEKRWVIFLVSE